MRIKIAFVSLAIALVVVNWSIYQKEKHLSEGRVVYLELAPVDPRSLMQGDYMALRFRLADYVFKALPKADDDQRWWRRIEAADGYVVAALDEKSVASFQRIHKSGDLISGNEILLRYRVRNGQVKFATNAFFFQEGHGKHYEAARFGLFRVNDNGELLLNAMCSENLDKLAPLDIK